MEPPQSGNEAFLYLYKSRDMDGGRDDIIRGLTQVDVIVRMDGPGAALTAHNFARPIRDDLIGVHVRRRAGAGLKDIDHEVLVELAICDFCRRSHYRVGDAWF